MDAPGAKPAGRVLSGNRPRSCEKDSFIPSRLSNCHARKQTLPYTGGRKVRVSTPGHSEGITMRKYLLAAIGAAFLLAPIGDASAQSSDGKNRWVTINNQSSFRTVVTLYAVPSHYNAGNISGRDWIPDVTIGPRQSYNVNFDDGRGTCYFDIRATSDTAGRDWIVRDFNVCAESAWNLRN